MDYEQIIIQRLEEGTLIREAWTAEEDGKELACLLAAIVPECRESEDEGSCPAEVMPLWLAYLTPWIDDMGTAEKWEDFIRRFAATSSRWRKLTQRHEYAVRALIVREAASHASNLEVLDICNRIIELCDSVAAGGEIDPEAFSTVAAWSAWSESSVKAAAWATVSKPSAVRDSATRATRASVLGEEAADRIIDGILRVLENA